MGLLRDLKRKVIKNINLKISNFNDQYNNSIYIQAESELQDEREMILINRFRLPKISEVVLYLKEMVEISNSTFELYNQKKIGLIKEHIHEGLIDEHPLETLLIYHRELAKGIEINSSKTMAELKRTFSRDIRPDSEEEQNYLNIKKGIVPLISIEEALINGHLRNQHYWLSVIKSYNSEIWNLDLHYNSNKNSLPKFNEIKNLLKNKTLSSKILRATNIDDYHYDMQNVIEDLYDFKLTPQQYLDWENLSFSKLMDLTLKGINNWSSNQERINFYEQLSESYRELFHQNSLSKKNKLLN